MRSRHCKTDAPLIEIKNVSVIKSEGKKVLDSISMTISIGENVAIIGPNGAGKSSLIKLITKEYYPYGDESGYTLKILGRQRWNIFDLRVMLGIVTEDLQYILSREITAYEAVVSGFFSSIGTYRNVITPAMKRLALSTLDFLEVGHLADRLMTEVSFGEARRILIGRALVHQPKALILDEPTNSLDVHAVHTFRTILRKIIRSGTSVVMVTHALSDIIPEITRVILMKRGTFLMDDTKEKALTEKHLRSLFQIPVVIKKHKGYFYAL